MNEYSPNKLIREEEKAKQVSSDVERIRKRYLYHETSIKSICLLYFLGALILIGFGAIILSFNDVPIVARAGLGLFFISIGLFQIWAGVSLRKLKSWAKIPVAILSGIGLIGAFPIGTIIHGYILYLVFSEKGAVVLSDDYKQIIQATPYIKYKTPTIIWVFLGLLILLAAIVFINVL